MLDPDNPSGREAGRISSCPPEIFGVLCINRNHPVRRTQISPKSFQKSNGPVRNPWCQLPLSQAQLRYQMHRNRIWYQKPQWNPGTFYCEHYYEQICSSFHGTETRKHEPLNWSILRQLSRQTPPDYLWIQELAAFFRRVAYSTKFLCDYWDKKIRSQSCFQFCGRCFFFWYSIFQIYPWTIHI